MVPLITAWCGHTDASREFVLDLVEAIGSEKKAGFAAAMGLTANQFSNQLAGVQPMSVFRLEMALAQHPEIALRLTALRLRRIGAELLTADQVALIRGAVALGKKRMARMCPALVQERKVS